MLQLYELIEVAARRGIVNIADGFVTTCDPSNDPTYVKPPGKIITLDCIAKMILETKYFDFFDTL
jgi:hypothetical protein